MAIVKCPECGRENVSNTAEACPSCGYNIKAHFENMGQQSETQTTVAESPSVPEGTVAPPILESRTAKKTQRKFPLKFILIAVVALIVVVGIALWTLLSDNSSVVLYENSFFPDFGAFAGCEPTVVLDNDGLTITFFYDIDDIENGDIGNYLDLCEECGLEPIALDISEKSLIPIKDKNGGYGFIGIAESSYQIMVGIPKEG